MSLLRRSLRGLSPIEARIDLQLLHRLGRMPARIRGDGYDSLHRFAVTERDFFRTVPMIPGARRVLRQLSDEGYRIRIITHRLSIHHFHQHAVSQTVDWLDRHGIPYWDLCFMKDKADIDFAVSFTCCRDSVLSFITFPFLPIFLVLASSDKKHLLGWCLGGNEWENKNIPDPLRML